MRSRIKQYFIHIFIATVEIEKALRCKGGGYKFQPGLECSAWAFVRQFLS
uniref:Uncharacterized protein n=1 Tax=Anguilla anguilla TaxID=7936 RepID=A0A0E9Q1E1_ANGAN